MRLGIDIGGTKIGVGIFEESGELLANTKLYVEGKSDFPIFIAEGVRKLCAEKGIDFSRITSCGAGVPGTVSADGRKVLKAPNLPISGETFVPELERELGIPVGVVQDSRAAAWGECLFGGGQGKNSVVCVTLGTGIGTGIVLDGKVFGGALGGAGELGHLPVVEGGRPCGCGKRGCLEKYSAGLGLDITAAELLGEGKKAPDLFEAAKNGNETAKKAVSDAAEALGKGLVSIVNLLSPDCILFSGGLSAQGEYVEAVTDYILSHCYDAGVKPEIKKAALGELSPLFGAAFTEVKKMRKPKLSASIMCGDALNYGETLKELEEAGVELVHYDIMDNHFVPNLMLPMELIPKLRKGTKMPFDIHIMAENPESVIEKLELSAGDYVAVHYEATAHLERAVSLIKAKGAKAAVAINPATPIEVLSEIVARLDMVLVMTVNPGFAGQKLVEGSLDKIRRMREYLDARGLEHVEIEVDGNCSFENVPKMYKAGAEIFVTGTSSTFHKDGNVKENTERLLKSL